MNAPSRNLEAVAPTGDGLIPPPVAPRRRLLRRPIPHPGVTLVATLAGTVLALYGALASPLASNGAARPALVIAAAALMLRAVRAFGRLVTGRPIDATVWLSIGWLGLLVVAAALANVLPLSEARDASATLADIPLATPDLASQHPLGTDKQGLDILGGVVLGARVSLLVGFGALLIGIVVGGGIGLIAGFYRGHVDRTSSFLSDVILAFPSLILLLALVTVLSPSVWSIMVGLGVVGIPIFVRLARINTISYARREFVTASECLGIPRRRILFKDLVPCVLPALLSYSFIVFAHFVVAEASLSFLGFGVQRPEPTWGNMIAAGQGDFDRYPHLVVGPGIALFFTVFALNKVGDAAFKRWQNPK